MSLADVEKAYVQEVIQACGGNVSKAAGVLGIDRRTVYRKLGEAEGRGDGEDS
jgi:DNA-binding protein Fis